MAFASGDMNFTIAADSGNLVRQADGSYLAVWSSGVTIWGQAFNADGSHRDGQFAIATGDTPRTDISATLLSNGDTIVTWAESNSVKAQRLGSNHQLIGTVKDLGSPEVENQHDPQVYDIGGGNYTVLYKGMNGFDLLAQTTVIGETIEKLGFASADGFDHAFVALTNGTLIVLYNGGHQIQLEDENNGFPKNIIRTDPDAPINQSATALADGKFAVVWQDNATVGGQSVIKAQVFDSSRDAVGAAVSFTAPPGAVRSLNITQLSDGGFALLVQVANGTDYDIYVATCSANGTVLIPPSLIGSSAAGDQVDPEIVALANGSFVVSWRDMPNSILRTEVFNAAPDDPEDTNTVPSNIHLTIGGTAASVEENKAGGFVVAIVTADDDGGSAGLRYFLTDNTFEIDAVTGQIRLKAGAVLDYERASSHVLSVTVKDKNGTGLSVTQSITIKVTDILESQQGTSSKNVLAGGIGADKLNGGSGNDVLTGGAGADIFVFNTALGKGTTPRNQNKRVNFDTISDFTPGEDKIWLDNRIFKKLGKAGSEATPASLNPKFFKMTKATDTNDYIIYKNGIVYYDADGSGARYKPVEVIKIGNKAKLHASDFLVI